jgi:glycogen debranching enzyme
MEKKPMSEFDSHLIKLRPRGETQIVSQGRSVLMTGRDGMIDPDSVQGLFVHQTRLVSKYRYLIDDRPPLLVAGANVEQHSWLGYYIAPPPDDDSSNPAQHTIELRVARFIGQGGREEISITNYTPKPARLTLAIEVDADFADQKEAGKERKQHGKRQRDVRQADGAWELAFDYQASNDFDHQGEKGTARIHRILRLRVERSDSKPTFADGKIQFAVHLDSQASWRASLVFIAFIDDRELAPRVTQCDFSGGTTSEDEKRKDFLNESMRFSAPTGRTLTPVVLRALEQGRRDLAALRLYDLDEDERSWVPAAGLPIYVALFGRDVLLTALEASLVSPDLLRGGLYQMARWQGTAINDWRDEQPGRMLHQAQTSPLSVLNINPFGRYYGSMTTSLLYPTVLFAAAITTGDYELVARYLEPAVRAIHWLDEYSDLNGDGFYEYTKLSTKGLKNQSWKDSGEAVVDEEGRQVPDPIASADVQALAYMAKLRLAELLRWRDRTDEAKKLEHDASELKKRFNDVFWLDDEGFYSEALGPDGRPIKAIGSDAGACIAAGIADSSRVPRTVERLMESDLFTGWGVRTLSSKNPAYNPYSYQRGSVWPAETAILALGFLRYGLHGPAERLCRAQFEAAALFDYCRLPEVFAGHPRDDHHPFPALYPQANWPQAWSAASVFSIVQTLLGLFPFAPLHTLVVDPHLPEWLPEITLEHLSIGNGSITIRFYREKDGRSSYQVLAERGTVHVVRQPSPWSLTASWWERVKDLVSSAV